MELTPYVSELQTHRDSAWAWTNFQDAVHDLIKRGEFKSILEVGGGRFPSFTEAQVRELGVRYTSNDISARELSLAPDWVGKAHFDIQTPDLTTLQGHEGAYDFVFSKMVMEHVASYDRAYRNIYRLLSPGGVAIAFHPVFYSPPFLLNKILPETLSRSLLKAMFPNRDDNGIPKFPAHYSGCVVSDGFRDKLKAMGFSGVWQAPFYGHTYYVKIPGLREAHERFSTYLAEKNFTPLASFTYTIVQK